jgi:hypothetical protein
MKKQSTQLIFLVSLVVIWAVLWHLYIKVPHNETPTSAPPPPPKANQSENLLRTRFHRVRAEMDVLYHYRLKPVPFDATWDPFRVPQGIDLSSDSGNVSPQGSQKTAQLEPTLNGPLPPDYAAKLLKSAIASLKIGGVVTLKGMTALTVDGQLHREGDVFSTKIPNSKGQFRSVILLVKHLSTESVTLALVDSEAGSAEVKVRLN